MNESIYLVEEKSNINDEINFICDSKNDINVKTKN